MTRCSACDIARTDPHTGRFNRDCQECDARSLASSPAYFDSARSGSMTPTYKAALRFVFGDDIAAGHARVKTWAALLKEGA